MPSNFKHFTLAILPFDISKASETNNPFDFKLSCSFTEDTNSVTAFSDKLKELIHNDGKAIIDSHKYHFHIGNLIALADKADNSHFLKVYKINPEHLYQDTHLRIQNKWTVNFSKSTYIAVNEFAQLGYFIFGFDMTGDEGVSLNDIASLEFFRFYTNDKSFKKYAMLTGNEETEITADNKLTIQDVIESSFRDLCPHIKLRYDRPMLLQLSNSGEIYPEHELNFILYNSLRIRAARIDKNIAIDQDYVLSSGSGVSICVLNEGASILDPSADSQKVLFNKYFPAFIIALNQREVMIQISQFASMLTYEQLDNSDRNNIRYLKKLKSRIENYKFKQLFYSVSFFDELFVFYQKLQSAMNINNLLKDNMECVNEIFARLEADAQEKRDLWINATLTGIGCLGLFSFFKDLIPFTLDNQPSTYFGKFSNYYKVFSSLSPFIVFVGLFRLMRKKNK
jgi:hypothetical protein